MLYLGAILYSVKHYLFSYSIHSSLSSITEHPTIKNIYRLFTPLWCLHISVLLISRSVIKYEHSHEQPKFILHQFPLPSLLSYITYMPTLTIFGIIWEDTAIFFTGHWKNSLFFGEFDHDKHVLFHVFQSICIVITFIPIFCFCKPTITDGFKLLILSWSLSLFLSNF